MSCFSFTDCTGKSPWAPAQVPLPTEIPTAEDTAIADSLPELQDDSKLTGDAAKEQQILSPFPKALQCISHNFLFASDQWLFKSPSYISVHQMLIIQLN